MFQVNANKCQFKWNLEELENKLVNVAKVRQQDTVHEDLSIEKPSWTLAIGILLTSPNSKFAKAERISARNTMKQLRSQVVNTQDAKIIRLFNQAMRALYNHSEIQRPSKDFPLYLPNKGSGGLIQVNFPSWNIPLVLPLDQLLDSCQFFNSTKEDTYEVDRFCKQNARLFFEMVINKQEIKTSPTLEKAIEFLQMLDYFKVTETKIRSLVYQYLIKCKIQGVSFELNSPREDVLSLACWMNVDTDEKIIRQLIPIKEHFCSVSVKILYSAINVNRLQNWIDTLNLFQQFSNQLNFLIDASTFSKTDTFSKFIQSDHFSSLLKNSKGNINIENHSHIKFNDYAAFLHKLPKGVLQGIVLNGHPSKDETVIKQILSYHSNIQYLEYPSECSLDEFPDPDTITSARNLIVLKLDGYRKVPIESFLEILSKQKYLTIGLFSNCHFMKQTSNREDYFRSEDENDPSEQLSPLDNSYLKQLDFSNARFGSTRSLLPNLLPAGLLSLNLENTDINDAFIRDLSRRCPHIQVLNIANCGSLSTEIYGFILDAFTLQHLSVGKNTSKYLEEEIKKRRIDLQHVEK